MPEPWTFAVASTGVRARKTGEAREAYNDASASAARVVAAWRERHPGDTRTLGQLAREHARFDELAWSPDLRARLDHFLAEDARVVAAADAFERADIAAIARLAAASQRDAERLLRNQVPETTELVTLALEAGAAAASSFGAGWGGSVWALVETTAAAPFLDQWLHHYRARHPYLTSEGFVSPPSDGIRRVE
jgi:galactokinase